MTRKATLRQIEAFKAVIENGTITRAAELLHISQPALSKLISNMEADTELKLFDRFKRRLVPTVQGMRLHEEVERIFAGVRQVDNAIEAIRREDQGRLNVGVMPGLASALIRDATSEFLKERPNVFCSVQMFSSPRVLDRLTARELDVGLIGAGFDNPYVRNVPLAEHPLVCVMPPGHPLASREKIVSSDLDGIPFVSFNRDSYIAHVIDAALDNRGVTLNVAMIANMAPTLCEFVAEGLGVSLLPPLLVARKVGPLVLRRFEPEIMYNFEVVSIADNRNSALIDAFTQSAQEAARVISSDVFELSQTRE